MNGALGLRGFFKGVGVDLIKSLPLTVLMVGTYLVTANWFRTHSRKERHEAYQKFLAFFWEDLVASFYVGGRC